MYRIPGDDTRRRPLLQCLYDPLQADVGVLLHDVQRASQGALHVWPPHTTAFEWYSGSAVVNAWRLGSAERGKHLLDLYELVPDTRSILRALFAEPGLQFPALHVRICPNPENEHDFDGELHIENNVAAWNSQDIVLLDPFAMWRKAKHQPLRNRYRQIMERLIARGDESPGLILFWTWGNAFLSADGDLNSINTPVANGYYGLRDRLHQVNRHFIRVIWRWGLQFAMWVLVAESHLNSLRTVLQDRCDELRDHLLHGCKGRLGNPEVAVVVD